jgi:hypothetical protein
VAGWHKAADINQGSCRSLFVLRWWDGSKPVFCEPCIGTAASLLQHVDVRRAKVGALGDDSMKIEAKSSFLTIKML